MGGMHIKKIGSKRKLRWAAFSLTELLIVISIMAVLLSLIMPSLQNVLYTARLNECQFRFKSWGTMFSLYTMDNNDKYPYDGNYQNGNRRWSRSFQLLLSAEPDMMKPYIFNNRPWQSMHSEQNVHSTMEKEYEALFLCPLTDNEEIWPYTNGWGGFHSRRVPRYATRTYPLMFFHSWTAEGQGQEELLQMRQMGDRWRLDYNTNQYSYGPDDATEYSYNILASSVMQHYRSAPYGKGWWGNNSILTSHIPLGAEAEVGTTHQNANVAWLMINDAAYDYNANYLLDSGAVVHYNDIPFMPDESSDYVKFNDGSVYVPIEHGISQD